MPGSPVDAQKEGIPSLRQLPPPSFLLAFVGLWFYLLFHLSGEWIRNPQYSFGIFVPVFCVTILWMRRDEWLNTPSSENQKLQVPWFLYFIAFGVLPIELWRQSSPGLRSIGYALGLICFYFTIWSIHALGHRKIPYVIWGVLFLFSTAIPWPSFFEVILVYRLKYLVTILVTDILNFFGILADAQGSLIQLSSGMVNIDDACSGVRSLQSCLMASVALALFFKLTLRKGAMLVLLGLFLALFGNLLRTLILSTVVALRGPMAFDKVHDPAGWTILFGVTLILYWAANAWQGNVEKSTTPGTLSNPALAKLPSITFPVYLGIFFFLLSHSWYWIHDYGHPINNKPVLSVNPKTRRNFEEVTIPDNVKELLRPQSCLYLRAFSERVGQVAIYQFFWETQEDTLPSVFHRPDLCMVGSGWELRGDIRKLSVPFAGKMTDWYLFSFEKGDQKMLQAWGVWQDGVQQQLDFTRDQLGFFTQVRQQWEMVKKGKRITNTEIVSVLVDGRFSNEQTLKQIIQDSFVTNAGSDT